MVVVPKPSTTPAPHPSLVFMPATSSATAQPPAATARPSAIPISERTQKPLNDEDFASKDDAEAAAFPMPKLRLEMRDVMHPGSHRFLSLTDASVLLPTAVANVQRLLYNCPGDHTTHMPPTRSVTVILRNMDGVAYTTGSELDSDHKEIHFSLSYIAGVRSASNDSAAQSAMEAGRRKGNRVADEIAGVITHELVHCYQWNAKGTCPGGLIEGIADFVRLRCDLSPPHWKRELDGDWDRGYQHTAYFLDYLEGRFGDGTVRRINEKLRNHGYHEKSFWTELLGGHVHQLWDDYVEDCRREERTANGE